MRYKILLFFPKFMIVNVLMICDLDVINAYSSKLMLFVHNVCFL